MFRLWVTLVLAGTVLGLDGCARTSRSDAVVIQLRSTDGGSIEVRGIDPAELRALDEAGLTNEAWSSLLEVSVASSDILDGGDGPVTAMLGHYQIDGDAIRFTPSFPFDPGRSYRVVWRPVDLPGAEEAAAEPVTAVVTLPARVKEPSTVVESIYPSGDLLPENHLKLYIHFSAPMSRGDGLRFVRLLDEQGKEVVDPFLPLGEAFWNSDGRRYTVFFDPGRVKRGILPNETLGRPIRNGKRYTLVVNDSWQDAEGAPLREPFRKEFRAGPPDEEPLDPNLWSVSIPRADTRDALILDFHEPLDHAILQRAISLIEVGSGRPIEGTIDITRNEQRWILTPDEFWSAGRYVILALTQLEDLAGNRIGKPFEVDVFEKPDLPEEQDVHRIPFTIAPAQDPTQ